MGTSRRILNIMLLVLAIVLEVFLLLELALSPGVESWKLPALWVQLQKNPNPQTEAAWKEERNRMCRINLAVDGGIIVLALANGFAIHFFYRKSIHNP